MLSRPRTALVLAGHGSTLNPDSAAPTREHAETIRRRGIFDEVVCAFWKEEPSLREVLRTVDSPEVYVVPNFISEGYFTTEVIPRELQLAGRTTRFPRQTVHYCDPVGLHPTMTKLLLKRAAEVAPNVPREQSSLIIVGHGTGMNENSTKAIKDQVALIRSMDCGFAEVLDAYMEEAPLIADWVQLTTAPNVIVVPFFIADGLHSYQDIPVLLGIEQEPTAAASRMPVFRTNPWHLHGRTLFFSSAIGTEPLMADVILDQVEAFDAASSASTAIATTPPDATAPAAGTPAEAPTPLPAADRPLLHSLAAWLAAGGRRIGEVLVLPADDGSYFLRHHLDSDGAGLNRITRVEEALEIVKYDAAGNFRPLKSAPTLIRGWEFAAPDLETLSRALDLFYPAAVGNWLRWREGGAAAPTLREMLGRQTGIYRITSILTEGEAGSLVTGLCRDQCLRRVMWTLDGTGPWECLPAGRQTAVANEAESGQPLPLLCLDICPLFTGAARKAVKERRKV